MKTIVFTTLFLGLVTGVQPVEVAVDGPVAEVELRLDGESVVRLAGPPWKGEVDLGQELAPRRLVARALDREGAEIGRAEQWLNVPRAHAEAELVLLRDDGGVEAVRPVWRSVQDAVPESLAVTLDGEPLPVTDPSHVPLPEHDPESVHVVSAELRFPGGTRARAVTAFGGRFAGETASELSALPVWVDQRRRLRSAEEAGDWVRVDDEPHPVRALDRGAVDLLVLIDRAADRHLRSLSLDLAQRLDVDAELVERGEYGDGSPRMLLRHERFSDTPLSAAGLEEGDRLYLVRATEEVSTSGFHLFGVSDPVGPEDGGLAWQLTYLRPTDWRADPRPQKLADAAALAGLHAAGGGRPRAVLVILGPGGVDASRFEPPAVRRYLARLGVPLRVWYLETTRPLTEAAAEGKDGEPAADELRRAARERWGEIAVVDGFPQWIRACRALRDELELQRILWIEGRHPPGTAELDGAPGWLRRVGAQVLRRASAEEER